MNCYSTQTQLEQMTESEGKEKDKAVVEKCQDIEVNSDDSYEATSLLMNMATHIKHALIIDIEKRYICVVYTLLCYVMIECLFFVHSFDINFIHFMLF